MKHRWIVPLVFMIILLSAMAFRWETTASKTVDSGFLKWERDRWTGNTWVCYYGIDQSGVRLAVPSQDYSYEREEKAYQLRRVLKYISRILVVIFIVWFLAELRYTLKHPKPAESPPAT